MKEPEPSIRVNVDLTNPGQFIACCGLLELADRRWRGTEAWFDFDDQQFLLHVPNEAGPATELLAAIVDVQINNSMRKKEVERRNELSSMSGKVRTAKKLDDEKKSLDKLWRESAVLIGAPFGIRIDWFLDTFSGGNAFKTWAGQQSVIDIARAMQQSVASLDLTSCSSGEWLTQKSEGGGVPFNFDSMLGGQGSDRDVGFSRDPLQISTAIRPLVELLAFVGLQRFRPNTTQARNHYRYVAWGRPLPVQLAAVVCSGGVTLSNSRDFEFQLLYRTKYLKSFLPANPIGVSR